MLGRMQYAPTHTGQISDKYVFIESYSRQGLDCPCRGVLHTPPDAHDHGQMIDPPDTFMGVCNTPLPIRIKNLIPIYWMNLKLGRFWDVCLFDQLQPGE